MEAQKSGIARCVEGGWNVDDMISRQAAIDAVTKRDANCGIDSAEVIKQLPSAQPEPCEDAVSRKKMFETVAEYEKQLREIYGNENELVETVKILKHRLLIELPSVQPDVPDTNVGDMISRQAAIDIVWEWFKKNGINGDRCLDGLRQLPSVQPETSTEIQEILDYLDTTLHPIVSPDKWYVYSELHDMISRLPSVQPELIRCKDCKWFGKVGCSVLIVDDSDKPTENDYCSFAERRTDE